MTPLSAGSSGDGKPRRRWTDWIIGITVGIVVGLGVLVYFVFVHSEGTIDAPSIKGGGAGQATTAKEEPAPEAQAPKEGEEPRPPAKKTPQGKEVPVVRVIGGAPPTGAGPKKLTFHKGEKVAFKIATDEPFSFEIRGLDVTESIEHTATISFQATKTGQFPVISTTTLIGVADLLIEPKKK